MKVRSNKIEKLSKSRQANENTQGKIAWHRNEKSINYMEIFSWEQYQN